MLYLTLSTSSCVVSPSADDVGCIKLLEGDLLCPINPTCSNAAPDNSWPSMVNTVIYFCSFTRADCWKPATGCCSADPQPQAPPSHTTSPDPDWRDHTANHPVVLRAGSLLQSKIFNLMAPSAGECGGKCDFFMYIFFYPRRKSKNIFGMKTHVQNEIIQSFYPLIWNYIR